VSALGAVPLFVCVLFAPFAVSQQEPMPDKLSPDMVKLLRDQEQKMKDAVEEAKKHPESKFGSLQCRADAQKWTSDPFDTKDGRNLFVNTAIMVNGQLRSIPTITPHVTVTGLMERTYEMAVCAEEDAEFEKQFATYSSLAKAYSEERCSRYTLFLLKHHLDEQFHKEDVEENK
jgi:hypothetical protein